jgi:hypothetical protein
MASKILVLVGLSPIVLLLITSAISGVSKLYSPCVVWGAGPDVVLHPSNLPECRGSTEGIDLTKQSWTTRLMIWEAVLLSFCLCALTGVFTARPFWGYLSAGLFLIVSVPLIVSPLVLLTLFTAGCCLGATILTVKARAVA